MKALADSASRISVSCQDVRGQRSEAPTAFQITGFPSRAASTAGVSQYANGRSTSAGADVG
jgi:hypothetical protein